MVNYQWDCIIQYGLVLVDQSQVGCTGFRTIYRISNILSLVSLLPLLISLKLRWACWEKVFSFRFSGRRSEGKSSLSLSTVCNVILWAFFVTIPIRLSRLERPWIGDSWITSVRAASLSEEVPDERTVRSQPAWEDFFWSCCFLYNAVSSSRSFAA